MFKSWPKIFGLKLFFSRKKRQLLKPMTFIAVAGLFFGLAATLTTLSVVGGFERAYEESILGFNAHVVLIKDGEIEKQDRVAEILSRFFSDKPGLDEQESALFEDEALSHSGFGLHIASQINRLFGDKTSLDKPTLPTIQAVTPFVFREGLGLLPDQVATVVLKGVDPKTFQNVYDLKFKSLSGTVMTSDQMKDSFAQDSANPAVVLGVQLAGQFFPNGLPQSEKDSVIRILIPKTESGSSIKDFTQKFRVVGTFESGLNEFDSQFSLMAIERMDKLFKMDGRISGYEMKLSSKTFAWAFARLIESKMFPGFQAVSWDELNENLFSAIKMEKTLFLIIMLMVLLVTSLNLMGVILMLVLFRKEDAWILRVMGASLSEIAEAFSIYGFMLGLVGTLLGAVFSWGILLFLQKSDLFHLDSQIYFIERLPVAFSPATWGAVILAGLFLSFVASRLSAKFILKSTLLGRSYR